MNLSTAGSSPGDDGPLPNGRMRVPRPPRLPQSPPPVAPRSYLDLQDTQRPRASSRSRSGSDATHPPHRFRCSYHYVSKLSASLAHSTGSVNRPVLYPNSGTDGVCGRAHLPEGCPLTAEAVGWEYHRYDPICFKFSK
jgi:hypothetical protein